MVRRRLTDRAVSAARAEDGKRLEMWDEQTPGLCLRVSEGGKKVWVWRYRTLDGRQPRLSLGDYSDQHGLRWARDQVEELRVRVRQGEDPAEQRKAAKREARSQVLRTFDDLADAYLLACEKGHWKPRRKQKRERTIEDERGVLRRHARPTLGDMRLEDIDRPVIRRLLTDMMDRGIGAQTNRTHAVIRQCFAFALGEERLMVNPAISIKKPATEAPRTRVLTDASFARFWAALERYPNDLRLPPKPGETEGVRLYVGRPMRIALQLAALLLVRRGEIAGMRVEELSLEQGLWLIPGVRMKSGAPHLVPLSPLAVSLIREAMTLAKGSSDEQPAHVFPSTHDPEKPFRPDSVTHAMMGMCAALGLPKASPHDMRRTGASALTSERIGMSPLIRSKVLAHRSDTGGGATVSAVHYDTNEYVAEKRRALEAWEALLLTFQVDGRSTLSEGN